MLRQECSWRAAINYPSSIQNENLIRSDYGIQPMGRHDAGNPRKYGFDIVGDRRFVRAIKGAGGFVKEQQAWPFVEGASDQDTLHLTGRERYSSHPHHRI